MKTDIKYIELKTGYSHNGPAWIGLVTYSKSGKTIYFDGKAFQKIGSDRMKGNFFDIETGEEYWISGVKKNKQDRHIYGNGKIQVEKRILTEYLKSINEKILNLKFYEIVELNEETPILRVNELENQKFESESKINDDKRFLKPNEMNDEELEYFIEYYQDDSINGQFLKGRKMSQNKMKELLEEKELRNQKPSANN